MRAAKMRAGAVIGAAAMAACFTLGGCSDRMLDTGPMNYVLGGGPPPDAPSPVRGLSPEQRAYPNLGSVPPRPTDVTSQAQRDADTARLSLARAENRAAAAAVKDAAATLPVPLDIPPPPALTPGKPR